MTVGNDAAIIPFAADRVAASQTEITETGDGVSISYRLPSVTVTAGTALRLNSGQLAFGDPPPIRDMPAVSDQLAFLNRYFQHQCGIWAKHARLFVDRYFAFVADEIRTHQADLLARLTPFGDLYLPEHWAFSAPRPLPRAHLTAPEAQADLPPDCLVAVEIAFWTAAGALAIDLIGSGTRGPRENHRRDRLEAAGIQVLEMPHALIDGKDSAAFAACLPDEFHAFWRDEVLPSGPFKSDFPPIDLPG